MKRIALLGFIIIGLPIIFASCNKCGPFKESFFTYSKIESNFMKPNFIDPYEQKDTIKDDTIRVNMNIEQDFLAKNFNKNNSYGNLIWACEPADAKVKNKIKDLIFGLYLNDDTLNANEMLLNSLFLRIPLTNYSWPKDKDAFFVDFNRLEPGRVQSSFLSPHNSKSIQFVTWAIKENGDTLKAISQKVFCK